MLKSQDPDVVLLKPTIYTNTIDTGNRMRSRHDTSTTPRCQTRLTVIHHFLRPQIIQRHRARALGYATLRHQELSHKQRELEAGPTHGSDNPCPLAHPTEKNLIKPIRAGAASSWQGVTDQIAP